MWSLIFARILINSGFCIGKPVSANDMRPFKGVTYRSLKTKASQVPASTCLSYTTSGDRLGPQRILSGISRMVISFSIDGACYGLPDTCVSSVQTVAYCHGFAPTWWYVAQSGLVCQALQSQKYMTATTRSFQCANRSPFSVNQVKA